MMCMARVDLPAISGPKTSGMRPRGACPVRFADSDVSLGEPACPEPAEWVEGLPSLDSLMGCAPRSYSPQADGIIARAGGGHNGQAAPLTARLMIRDRRVPRPRARSEAPRRSGNEDEEEAGHHGRQVYHADAGHELADGGQDRLRDVVDNHVEGVVGVEGDPGENDAEEDGGQQYVGQDLYE